MTKYMATVALTAALLVPRLAVATPTDSVVQNTAVGFMVMMYKQTATGDVTVRLSSGGVSGCATELVVAMNHPLFEGLSRTLAIGHELKRRVDVGYEAIDGVCYVKSVAVASS